GGGLARRAHGAAPARRHRFRHRVPDPPLLPVVEAERAVVRRRAPAGGAARRAARARRARSGRVSAPAPRATTLRYEEIEVGAALPELAVPITATVIVAG